MPEKQSGGLERSAQLTEQYHPTMTVDYSRISDTARAVEIQVWPGIAAYLESIHEVIARQPYESAFAIADFGAADGVNSSRLFELIVTQVHSFNPELPVKLIYIDLAEQAPFDRFWSSSGLAAMDKVEAVYFKRSFYEPFPELKGSLNIAFSSTALHWLNTRDIRADFFRHPRAIQPNQLTDSERLRFRLKWEKDWRLFLGQCALEIKEGGLLCLVNLADLGDDHWPASAGYNHLRDICNLLCQEGRISEEELASVFIPDYFPTPQEIQQVVEDELISAHFTISSLEAMTVPCAYYSQFRERSGDVDSRRQLADSLARVVRAWSESSLRVGLASEHKHLVDEVYRRLAESFFQTPAGLPYQYCLLEMIRRENNGRIALSAPPAGNGKN